MSVAHVVTITTGAYLSPAGLDCLQELVKSVRSLFHAADEETPRGSLTTAGTVPNKHSMAHEGTWYFLLIILSKPYS